jgi:hypothetical protein
MLQRKGLRALPCVKGGREVISARLAPKVVVMTAGHQPVEASMNANRKPFLSAVSSEFAAYRTLLV